MELISTRKIAAYILSKLNSDNFTERIDRNLARM